MQSENGVISKSTAFPGRSCATAMSTDGNNPIIAHNNKFAVLFMGFSLPGSICQSSGSVVRLVLAGSQIIIIVHNINYYFKAGVITGFGSN